MKLCVPIRQVKAKVVIEELKKAQLLADVVEIWLDEIHDLNDQTTEVIAKIATKPLLYKVTKFDLPNLFKILNSIRKIAYLDLDISTDKSLVAKVKKAFPQIQIIVSHHNFQSTPTLSELQKLITTMKAIPADIIKIATQANSISDSLNMLSFLSQQNHQEQKFICLCMGKYGRLTRLTGHLFGNYLMYAPMRAAHKTADGQLSITELRKALKSIN